MAGSRSVTGDTLTAAGAGVSKPSWFLQIDWSNFSTRLCSYGLQTWNGYVWPGGGFKVSGFEADGKPGSVVLSDPDGAFRTLALTEGILDRSVSIWKAYIGTLAAGDPVLIFSGFADGVQIGGGEVTIGLDWQTSARQFSPRERIGPAIGVHFLATPNTTVGWNNTLINIAGR